MIPVRSDVRIWLATGCTDMRRGMFGLALQVLKRDPHAGDLYIFPGRRGDLMKVLWHDGIGMSLYASGSTAGGSSGRRQPTAWWRSRRRRWRVCWK
jgi:transposase